jgi:hypothetical protein
MKANMSIPTSEQSLLNLNDLKKLSIASLQEIAKELEITDIARANKQEIILKPQQLTARKFVAKEF